MAHSYMRSDYNGVLEADYAREAYSRLAVEIMKAVNFYNYNNRDRELHDLYICGGGGGIEPMLRTIVETTRLTLHPSPSCSRSSFRPRSRGRICVPSAV